MSFDDINSEGEGYTAAQEFAQHMNFSRGSVKDGGVNDYTIYPHLPYR